MTPTPKQSEFIEFARVQAKPIAWLGSVRGGKTVGGLLAMIDAMERNPGDYAITSVGQQNLDVNITPVVKEILEDKEVEFKHYKTPPQRFETSMGTIPVYLAGNEGQQKFMQGVTLRGAFSDEILLYPMNFVMQLVARFSHDNPFWVFTANKEKPSHWIKTEWIDEGKVALFESGSKDNPHISDDARQWWDSLLEGKYRDRMLGNEWSGDYGLIGTPCTLARRRKPARYDRVLRSVWIDEAKGNSCATVTRTNSGIYHLSDPETFDTIEALTKHLRQSGLYTVANEQPGEPPKFSRCTFIAPEVTDFATEYSRLIGQVRLAPNMSDRLPEFRRWSWVAADSTGTKYKPDEATGNVLACALAVYYASMTAKAVPFSIKGGTI